MEVSFVLVVLAVKKKLLLHYQLCTKEKRHKVRYNIFFVILLMFPKFWCTPRKFVNKISCGFFNLPVRKVMVFADN